MAALKVFVSSTYYDLSTIRGQIRSLIYNMGYEPIMSEYSDILYDPRDHTHTSCIDEINNCDLIILIVGSRFGGRAVSEAIQKLDFDKLLEKSKNKEFLKGKDSLSVTQIEILKAFELEIPVFTFIDSRLWNDHALYEKNKGKKVNIVDENKVNKELELSKMISYPSIDKPESAEFIFEFINFIRLKNNGNSITPFSKFEEIEQTLKKQMSGLFQRLLREVRNKIMEEKKIDVLSSQLEDLKTAILTSVSDSKEREVAKGVVRYRKLFDFIKGLNVNPMSSYFFEDGNRCWNDFFKEKAGVVKVESLSSLGLSRAGRMHRFRTFLIKKDKTFFELMFGKDYVEKMGQEFDDFMNLSKKSRKIIFEALNELPQPLSMVLRYREENFDVFCARNYEERLKEHDEDSEFINLKL